MKTADLIDNPEENDEPRGLCWSGLYEPFMELFEQLFKAESDGGEVDNWRVDTQFMSWGGTVYWGHPGTSARIRSHIDKIAAAVQRLLERLPSLT
jgi:hypothetical protein